MQWVGGDPNPGSAFTVNEDGSYVVRRGYYFYKQITRAGQPGMAVCRTLSMDTEIPVLAFGKKNTKNQDVFVLTNINSVLLIGLIPVIPACLIAGILLSKFFRKLDVKPPTELHEEKHFEKSKLPDLGISIFTMLIPVLLMLFGAIVDLVFGLPPGKHRTACQRHDPD